jgi:hypothetical protein
MGMSNFRVAEKKSRRGLWPLYGLLMALALGAISYVLGPVVLQFMRSRSAQFSIGTLNDQQVELLLSGIVFVLLLAFATLILAVAAPKKKSEVKDAALVKEKRQMEVERKQRRKRELEIQRKLRESNRRLD